MALNILYEKNDVREAWNQKVLKQINESEKNCTPFPISCHQRDGVWGIWFQVGEEFLLVNPIELVSSVFVDDEYCLLEYYNKEFDGQKPKGYFYVNTRCENHAFHWRLSHTMLYFSGLRSFTIEEYLTKTKKVVEELYQAWSKNESVAYDKFDVELDGVEMCKRQMEIKAVLPSNYILMNSSVQEEVFYFHPVNNKFSENYSIGIGNREYKTFFTDWDNDLECIRHQLETYVYEREATLKLSFDMSDTVVNIQKKSVLDHTEESHGGCAYKYKDYVLAEVRPNEFVHMPVLKGYCNEKETIRTLYEGLLRHVMRFPLESEDYHLPDKMVAYNMIKSPLIESFLKEEKYDFNAYAIRQVHVKHILTIDPDVMQLFHDEEQVAYDGFYDVYDKEGKPIEMNELLEWHKEIEPIVIASETGSEYKKDWADYHKRGLELAKQLREKLSTDFDLWYTAPWEDKSGTIKRPRLII